MATSVKHSRARISLQDKLDAIEKGESGWTQKQVADHYGIARQTVSDIKHTINISNVRFSLRCFMYYTSESDSA